MALLYFAYGSNLHFEQMRQRCGEVIDQGLGVLDDHRLVFAGRSRRWQLGGVAHVEPAAGGSVPGVLYALEEAALVTLDRYEGHPRRYRRTDVRVRRDEEVVDAIAYLRIDGPALTAPSASYLATIAHAYGRRGWSLDPLLRAAEHSN